MPSRPVRPPSATMRSPGRGGVAVQSLGRNTHTPAVDQGIGHIVLIVEDGTRDRGDAHLVAVVLDAGDDATGDAPWMQRTAGDAVSVQVERAEAEHVGVGDRLGGDADDVADHAAHAGVCAAEGLQRRWMVVRLGFERDLVRVVEIDDAGVIDER